jgi:hypothetical protein
MKTEARQLIWRMISMKQVVSHTSSQHKLHVIFQLFTPGAQLVWQDPHLHSTVSSTREDVICWPRFNLHHSGSNVPKKGLSGVFTDKSMEKTEGRKTPNLKDIENIMKSGAADYLKNH